VRLTKLEFEHIAIAGTAKLITRLSEGVTDAKDLDSLQFTLVDTLLHNLSGLLLPHNYRKSVVKRKSG